MVGMYILRIGVYLALFALTGISLDQGTIVPLIIYIEMLMSLVFQMFLPRYLLLYWRPCPSPRPRGSRPHPWLWPSLWVH